MRRFLLVLLGCLIPWQVAAATVDLAIETSDISFSKETLIAGDRVRIYAAVHNLGDTDVAGYVSFSQGSIPVGDSQVISVRSDGAAEEVFVDFTVPSGSFNIRAEIRGTDPQDENAENDEAMTALITPLFDDDRDGVLNDNDNCVDEENADQKDTDGDGKGDACDEDDDDDTVSDDVEAEIGTDPQNPDSDADGQADADDLYPTQVGEPPVEPTSTTSSVLTESFALSEPTEPTAGSAPEASEEEQDTTEAAVFTSPQAVFTYERERWNTFLFRAQVPDVEGYRVEWDFGDGVTSTRFEVEHTFREYRDFYVSVRVTDPTGNTAMDATTINVPFFTIGNRLIQMLIGILFLVLLLAFVVWYRIGRTAPRVESSPHVSDLE